MCVLKAMIRKRFNQGTLILNDHMGIDPTLAFVAVACLSEDGVDALGSHDWFPDEYKKGELSHVGWICADGSQVS